MKTNIIILTLLVSLSAGCSYSVKDFLHDMVSTAAYVYTMPQNPTVAQTVQHTVNHATRNTLTSNAIYTPQSSGCALIVRDENIVTGTTCNPK